MPPPFALDEPVPAGLRSQPQLRNPRFGIRIERPAGTRCAACNEGRSRLVETLPALNLYYAVAVKGGGGAEGCGSPCTCGASSEAYEPSPIGSPLSILSPGTYIYTKPLSICHPSSCRFDL